APDWCHWRNIRESAANVATTMLRAMPEIAPANPDTLYRVFDELLKDRGVRSKPHAMVCELLPGDRKCTQGFASFSQEIGNARDGLRAFLRRSQMHAIVCELLPGDRKCTRSFASFSQEIANARDRLRASPRRSQMHAIVCELLPGDRNPSRSFLRRFCGRNSSQTFQGVREVADK